MAFIEKGVGEVWRYFQKEHFMCSINWKIARNAGLLVWALAKNRIVKLSTDNPQVIHKWTTCGQPVHNL